MVLKKPYAFLIKYFKLIHIILCLPMLYLIIKTGNIAQFFSTYIHNNYYTNIVHIAGTYINYFMYLAIIVIIIIALAIYFLMRQKDKNTKYYAFILFYYLLLFVLMTISYGILSSFEDTTITAQTVRVYRDIAYIAYFPQFFFFGYTLLRGIGFDLKKFNFDDDIKELEITDVDNEEFELEIGKDFYKYKRSVRRFIREFKYYFLENKVAFVAIFSFVLIAIGTILYLNFGVYHKTYRETQKISHNGLVVKVMDSVLTDMDQGGRKIKDEKIYLAVSLNVTNRSLVGARLDYENFKVLLDKKYIMPTLDRGSYFPDFGTSYTRDTQIPAKESKNYVLTYEFDEGMKNKNFNMRILESLESTLAGITPVYKEINLKYDKVFTKKDVATYQLGKIAEFSKTRLGLTQVQFKEYQLGSSFTYDYKKCNASNCQNLKGIATIDPKYRNKTILAVKKKFQLDPTSMYFQVRGGGGSFVNDFLRVRYQLNDKIKEENVINITPLELKDWWVLLVPSETAKASKIDILIDVRGSIYVMNLKEK